MAIAKKASSSDKKEYQNVLATLASHSTTASFINKLAKSWASTEDEQLKKGLAAILSVLKKISRTQSKPGAVWAIRLTEDPFGAVAKYCNRCIQSAKPQWQIIAEQHGWGPKE